MPEQKPIPVDYHTPSAIAPRPVTSIGLTIYLGFLTLIVLVFGWFILPKFEAVFADFGTDLPLISMAVMRMTGLLTRGPGIVLLLAVPVVVPMLVTRMVHSRTTPGQTGKRLLIVYLIITLVTAVLVLCAALAVILPLVNLMQAVSSPKQGGG